MKSASGALPARQRAGRGAEAADGRPCPRWSATAGPRHWSEWLLDYARAWRARAATVPRQHLSRRYRRPVRRRRSTTPSAPSSFSSLPFLRHGGSGSIPSPGPHDLRLVTGELEYEAAARVGKPVSPVLRGNWLRGARRGPIMHRLSLVWPGPEETFDEAVRTLLAGVAADGGPGTPSLGRGWLGKALSRPRRAGSGSENACREGAMMVPVACDLRDTGDCRRPC